MKEMEQHLPIIRITVPLGIAPYSFIQSLVEIKRFWLELTVKVRMTTDNLLFAAIYHRLTHSCLLSHVLF